MENINITTLREGAMEPAQHVAQVTSLELEAMTNHDLAVYTKKAFVESLAAWDKYSRRASETYPALMELERRYEKLPGNRTDLGEGFGDMGWYDFLKSCGVTPGSYRVWKSRLTNLTKWLETDKEAVDGGTSDDVAQQSSSRPRINGSNQDEYVLESTPTLPRITDHEYDRRMPLNRGIRTPDWVRVEKEERERLAKEAIPIQEHVSTHVAAIEASTPTGCPTPNDYPPARSYSEAKRMFVCGDPKPDDRRAERARLERQLRQWDPEAAEQWMDEYMIEGLKYHLDELRALSIGLGTKHGVLLSEHLTS
jgi:hypothetical protein